MIVAYAYQRARGAALLFSALAFLATAAFAIDSLEFDVARIAGAGWRADDVKVRLGWADEERANARVEIEKLVSELGVILDNVRIECPRVEISTEAFACTRATVRLVSGELGAQRLQASVRYARATGALDVSLENMKLGEGAAHLRAHLGERGWRASVRLERASVDALLRLAQKAGAPLAGITAPAGVVTLSANARGVDRRVHALDVSAALDGVSANNESGSLASEQLTGEFTAALSAHANAWRFNIEMRSQAGQAYAEPIFLDFNAHAIHASARGEWGGERVSVEHFSWDHAGVARAQGRAELDLADEAPLRTLDVQLAKIVFPGAYTSYLQPLLLDTNFKAMTTSGEARGQLSIADGAPQSLDLDLTKVSFDDGAQRFVLRELDGALRWRTGQQAPSSRLQWRDGALLGLTLGRSDLQFVTHGGDLRLLSAARVPVLDGALNVQRLAVRNIGTPEVAFDIDAALEPISVPLLCRAFDWPEFGGRLSGEISQLQMREGVVTLGAALAAQVFDGVVKVRDLRLEEPFGKWPRLQTSIAVENLDLELVTSAFSFGRITGRLSGDVEELRLFNWSPVAFDAHFYTPAADRSRRRISQRAVQNIGSIGGGGAGVTAALSSGFLRFFDDFNYRRLGISCRLENEVCYMSGVGPAPNGGYYLVQGSGVPRIDVIGSASRVDWPRLVQQLIALTETEGPVVE